MLILMPGLLTELLTMLAKESSVVLAGTSMLYSLPAYEYENFCDAPEVLMISVLLLKTYPVLAQTALLATCVTLVLVPAFYRLLARHTQAPELQGQLLEQALAAERVVRDEGDPSPHPTGDSAHPTDSANP